VIAFDGYLFACSVHALDLVIGPGMIDLGELDAVIRQERANSLWQSGDQVAQQFRRSPFAFLLM